MQRSAPGGWRRMEPPRGRALDRVLLPILAAAALAGLSPVSSSAGVLAPEVRELARSIDPDQTVAVLIRLNDPLDLGAFLAESARSRETRATRRARLVRRLQERARRSSRALRALLDREGVGSVRTLWIHGGLAVELPVRLLDTIAARPEVQRIRLDAVVHMAEPVAGASAAAGWNLTAVQAPALWGEGHTGQGVVVALMDTGVDAFHPDVGPQQRPADSWFDPYAEHSTPYDATGHGTSALGLILGGDQSGQTIGMAPDAQWIAVKMFNDAGQGILSDMHMGYQWLLDPDGDPGTDDLPDIANNSWTLDALDVCELEFAADIASLRAADVAVVFAAGNFGPSPSTSVGPANNPGSLAVGAVDSLFEVASISSRGPSACETDPYPRLSAPGVNVYTADLTLGGIFPESWRTVTGTSFAAPHVSGALALLRGAHPAVPVSELEGALLSGALDLGVAGPDDDTGWGLLDVYAAHELLGAPPAVPALQPWALVLVAALLLAVAVTHN
jgi:serine protease AprX